jgi:Flp pilus assembly protein TadB
MAFSAIAAAAVAGTGYSIYSGEKARKSQKRQATQAAADAERARVQADRDYNKLNQKTPNIAALMKRNQDAATKGVGGTFLTGNSGAPVGGGMLGRSTLLGR